MVYRFPDSHSTDGGTDGEVGEGAEPEVLIGHMGGPFWARKDAGAWSLPKGEYDPGSERPLAAALRELEEETGSPAPVGTYRELGEVKVSGGKVITAFAVEGDLDLTTFVSNLFELEWPRGSGRTRQFPELDRAAWVPLTDAATRLTRSQVPLLDRLRVILTAQADDPA